VKRFPIAVMFVMALMGFTLSPISSTFAQPTDAFSAATPATARAAVTEAAATEAVTETITKPWKPTPGPHFNVPRTDDERQWRIEREILAAINHARKGSLIQISVFSLDRKVVSEALINARRRGVMVRVLMNNHQNNRAMGMLHLRLGTDRTRKNFAYECTYGCRSRGENLHTKMFLFSHTGGARNVVMTGSTNLTFNAAGNQWNDLLVRNDVPKMYAAFSTLFEQMRLDKPVKDPYYKVAIGEKYELQVLPFPDFSPTHDPAMLMLNRVHCWGARGGTGISGRTVVRISMHAWNDWRGGYIAEKVRSLFAEGCDVRVIYGMASANVRQIFATRTKRGYLPVHISGYDTEEVGGLDGQIDLYGHQKILAISGNYWGDSSTSFVFTGSSNWNAGGAKGDEIIFRAEGATLVSRYRQNFNYIWENGSHLAKYIPYPSTDSTTFFRTAVETAPSPGGPAWETD
jgi:phosphatidylserine/phosphatidylglycerophosphate/cardiolipin synthase-like enzyme